MRRKTISLLIFLLLFSQSIFPLRAQENLPAGQNELINLLYQPEMAATIDVRRLLGETVTELFSSDPSSIANLKKAMKQIEDETGIDPFQINQFAIGMSFNKTAPENMIIAIRTNTPAAGLAEKIFQNRVAQGKFTLEKDPVGKRLNWLKFSTFSGMSEVSPEEIENKASGFNELSANITAIRASLAMTRAVKTNQALLRDLNNNASQIASAMNKITETLKIDADLSDEKTRFEKLEKEFENISVSDPHRVQKIAALGKQLEQFEKSSSAKLKKLRQLNSLFISEITDPLSDAPLHSALALLGKLPAAEPKRTQNLRAARKHLMEFQKILDQKLAEIETEDSSETPTFASNILKSVDVSRKEENIGGKRVLVITTKQIYADEEMNSENENLLAVYSDNILLTGDRDAIKNTLGQAAADSANRNPNISRMLAKTPNALLAFAIDLQDVDLSDLDDLLGEQQINTWEIFGGVSGVSNEIALSISIEKSGIPLKSQPRTAKKEDSIIPRPKLPIVEDDSAVGELFKLLGNSLTGVEGKFTFKFDKKKTAQIVTETPKLLSSFFKNEPSAKTLNQVSGK
jgi:hypothetical protein